MVDVNSDIHPTVHRDSSKVRPLRASQAKRWLGEAQPKKRSWLSPMSIFRLGYNNARSSEAARYINLTVASEGQTRRKLSEKAELAVASDPPRSCVRPRASRAKSWLGEAQPKKRSWLLPMSIFRLDFNNARSSAAARSRSGGTLALRLDNVGQLRDPAEQAAQCIQPWDLDGQRHLGRAVFLV